jgi:hypothetical protein
MEKISEVLIESTGQTVKLEGEKGTTFTPSVDANGNLSWTNDGGKQNPTTVNIKGERGEKGDTTVIDPSTGTVYTLYNQTGKHTDGAMTQAAVTEEFEKLDEVYARNDGYYESMGVGMATNLKGQNVVDAEFTYRKSGGNVEVQDGNAMVEAIKGNTIAWNQLFKNDSSYWSDGAGSISFSETTVTLTSSNYAEKFSPRITINGHNYYTKVNVFSLTDGNIVRISQSDTYHFITPKAVAGTYSSIKTATANERIRIVSGNGTAVIKDVLFIDLTLIYGEGNEPSTPEQFEQDYFNWFGKPLTYEPYDAGSLRNTKISALKTTGFNQWDEEWENGNISNVDGSNVTASNRWRSSYIPVIGGRTYYFACPTNPSKNINLFAYDANKNFIATYFNGWVYGGSISSTNVIGKSIQVPNKCSYLRIKYGSTDEASYQHDICINISDPNRNGEYEPYKESTLPLDVTTLTGKLNGEGSSVVVFADGMNSAGDVHDEIKIENGVVKAIKRVGSVDLGSLTWELGERFFMATLNGYKEGTDATFKQNSVCSKYPTITPLEVYNKQYGISTGSAGVSLKKVLCHDDTYTDATTFKTAMNGVMLYYELAEPEVYVLDDFNLPKLYPVANGGTEEQLSNAQNSLPATLSIRYGLNAAAFIQNAPKNYISKESMTNFLSNLGSAMGGTWTMTWNSSTNKYDFSFTQNRSTNVEQPIEDK